MRVPLTHSGASVSLVGGTQPESGEPITIDRRALNFRQIVMFSGRLLPSAGLLWFILPRLSLQELGSHLQAFDFRLFALIPVLLLLMTFLSSMRWQRISAVVACPLRWADAWRVCVIAVFFDQLIFNMSGDALRAWWLNKWVRAVTHAMTAVLLDRIMGVLALCILVLAAVPFLARNPAGGPLIWAPLVLVVAALAGVAVVLMFRSLPLRRIPFSANLNILSSGVRAVLLRWPYAAQTLGLALLVQGCWPLIVAVISAALGVKISLMWCFLIVPAVVFITMLPISVGGWGVRETAMVAGLGVAGVSDVDAALISILAGLCTAGLGLFGGLVWLFFGLPDLPPAPAEVQENPAS